ncbi:putative sugar isomerase YihS [Hartmannibacter diazotrophicus]|uniref:Putative sugar isomerase YihS n=1 Tax=Hartmannibacter diazotrophicus TaxID=1482074 RepID=A0A2C9DAP8_9HYPH|nr:AGE family epimerase/isomerase [Hartmannibacter diazotrophicus]SON57240.1 putative sugar isomerase YihS [Hartmannibacter diazotrophicus]
MQDQSGAGLLPWRKRAGHRGFLARQAEQLFDFFQVASINPRGGFFELTVEGAPRDGGNVLRQIHTTARMVHCFAIAALMGRPGADDIVDHGLTCLWEQHRDDKHGGYVWSFDDGGPVDASKQAYGHAFVLLAAASGCQLGHPLARRLLDDVTVVLDERFWEERHGAVAEEFDRDWSPLGDYRGQNSNMHLTEALMAAFEATGEPLYLARAERIAALVIAKNAAGNRYRLPEHFDSEWRLVRDYRNGDMFRPFGTTPGHSLEWARLLLQLWVLGDRRHDWMKTAARALFRTAIETGWDEAAGGFFYTLDWDDRPHLPFKLWWPCAEAIGAAAYLAELDPDPFHEDWYRRIWNFTANHFIDFDCDGWHAELGVDLQPAETLFVGKPDIYHALQACLIPLYPARGGIVQEVKRAEMPAT